MGDLAPSFSHSAPLPDAVNVKLNRNVHTRSPQMRYVLNTYRNDRKDVSSYKTNDADPRYESRTTVNNNDHSRVLVLSSGGYPVTRYPVNDDTVRKVRRVTRPENMIVLLFERADRKATGVLQQPDSFSPHLETVVIQV